jgi:hypothetical protein
MLGRLGHLGGDQVQTEQMLAIHHGLASSA